MKNNIGRFFNNCKRTEEAWCKFSSLVWSSTSLFFSSALEPYTDQTPIPMCVFFVAPFCRTRGSQFMTFCVGQSKARKQGQTPNIKAPFLLALGGATGSPRLEKSRVKRSEMESRSMFLVKVWRCYLILSNHVNYIKFQNSV